MVAVGPHSWNATVLAVDGDEITTRFGVGEINYRWSGAWYEIRNEFRADGIGWINDESKWSIYCPRYADERTVLVNENAWDVANNCEITPDGNAIIEFDSPYASHVEGEIDPLRPGRILYRNAYGPGVHKAVGKWHGRSVRGEGLPIVEAMPAGDQDAVFVERIITPMHMLGGWDGSLREIGSTGCVLTTVNGDAGIRVLPAKAWYYTPAGELVTIPISVTVERDGGYVILRKTIPRWFCAAAIAVGAAAMADETTVTYSPNGYPETTSVDGAVWRNAISETYSTIRGGAGTIYSNASTTEYFHYLRTNNSSNSRYTDLGRYIMTFDTTTILSSYVVTAATLEVYSTANVITFGSAWTSRIVSSTPASSSAIQASDYSQVSTTVVDLGGVASGSITPNAYTLWNLSTSSITKGGITKLGSRSNGDVSGTAEFTAKALWNAHEIKTAESAFAPKLTVTYTGGGGGNRRRRFLLAGLR